MSFARAALRIRQGQCERSVLACPARRPGRRLAGAASAAGTVVGSLGRTRSSSLRELMSSLVKTLRRWYLTVRGLMNSRVPISGFESPSRASRAICASWAVSSSRVSTVRLRTVSPVASSSRRARSANASDAHRRQHLVGGAQLLARVDAPVLAAQPLAVEQMGAGELHADAGTAEAFDRLAVETVGDVALAEQGADAGLDPQRPLGGRHARAFGQPLECGPDERDVTGPGRRLGQLGHDKGPEPHLVALERSPSGVARGVVATEAVVEHRGRSSSRGAQSCPDRLRSPPARWPRSAQTRTPPGRARPRASSRCTRSARSRSPRRSADPLRTAAPPRSTRRRQGGSRRGG